MSRGWRGERDRGRRERRVKERQAEYGSYGWVVGMESEI
jgi:hypothetical protein